MADKIIEDLRQKLNKIELTVMDGDEQITFETVEQLEAYKKGRKLLEEVYFDLVLNGRT